VPGVTGNSAQRPGSRPISELGELAPGLGIRPPDFGSALVVRNKQTGSTTLRPGRNGPTLAAVTPSCPARSRSMLGRSTPRIVERFVVLKGRGVREPGRVRREPFRRTPGWPQGPAHLTLISTGVGAPKFMICVTMSAASKENWQPGNCDGKRFSQLILEFVHMDVRGRIQRDAQDRFMLAARP